LTPRKAACKQFCPASNLSAPQAFLTCPALISREDGIYWREVLVLPGYDETFLSEAERGRLASPYGFRDLLAALRHCEFAVFPQLPQPFQGPIRDPAQFAMEPGGYCVVFTALKASIKGNRDLPGCQSAAFIKPSRMFVSQDEQPPGKSERIAAARFPPWAAYPC